MVIPGPIRARVLVGLVVLVGVLGGCGSPPRSAEAVPPRVMPLGDSITDGFNIPGGYRMDLEALLDRAGTPVDFVGSMVNGPPAFDDPQHEGHSGWRIDEIAGSASTWLKTHDPDVVLLLIGTNDVVQDHALRTAPERLRDLVDQIVARVPRATILVSSLPPLADAADERQVRAYNAAIRRSVEGDAARGGRVRFVDMHARLTTGHLADGVHPNAAGYSRMAMAWASALRPVLRPGS